MEKSIHSLYFKNCRNKAALCVFFFLFLSDFLHAQDAVFSQYYASSLYLNPAMAGLQPDISLTSNYRVQWNSISPYKTGQVSLIYPFLNKNKPAHEHWGGAGVSMFQDISGGNSAYQVTGANINLAYNLPLSVEKHQLISFGLQAGIIQQRINPDSYEWGTKYTTGNNAIDPDVASQAGLISAVKIRPDLSAGVIWYLNNSRKDEEKKISSFAGLSLYHINSPDQSMVQGQTSHLPRLFKFHGGMRIHLTQKTSISPNFIVAMQNRQYQYNPGMYLSYRITQSDKGVLSEADLILGSWYRVKDAFIFSTGLSSQFFTLGLSYDLNSSALKTYTGGKGAYEVSLSIRIPRSLKLLRYDTPRI